MTHGLTEYFRREMLAAGYEAKTRSQGYSFRGKTTYREEPNIYWSLCYCQGDGMAFEATCDLKVIAKRLKFKPHQIAAIGRAIEKAGAYIKVTHSGRYYHWNSMSVDWNEYDMEQAGCSEFDINTVRELAKVIERDVKDISRRLEREGHNYLEHTNPARFVKNPVRSEFDQRSWAVIKEKVIGRFRIEVKLVEDDNWSPYEWGNGDDDHRDAKRIVAGETVACGVIVTIFDAETDDELGGASLWGISDDTDLRYIRKQVMFELLAEARQKARETTAATVARYSREPGAAKAIIAKAER